MKFGELNLKTCNDCPAYKWAGESISAGDCGYYCAFGAFRAVSGEKQIPKNCPIRDLRNKLKLYTKNIVEVK